MTCGDRTDEGIHSWTNCRPCELTVRGVSSSRGPTGVSAAAVGAAHEESEQAPCLSSREVAGQQ